MFGFSSPFKPSSHSSSPPVSSATAPATPTTPTRSPTPRNNNNNEKGAEELFFTCDTSPIRSTAAPPNGAPATPFTLMRSPMPPPTNRRQSSGLNNLSNTLFSSPTPPVMHFAKSPKIPSSRTISVVSSRQNSPSPIQEEQQYHQGSVGSSPSIFYLGRAAKPLTPSTTLQVRETTANHALLEVRQVVDWCESDDAGGSVFDDVESIDGLVRDFHPPAYFSLQRPHSTSLHSQDDDNAVNTNNVSMYEAEVPAEESEEDGDDSEGEEEEDDLPVVYLRGEMSILMDEEDDGDGSTLPNSPAMSNLEFNTPIKFVAAFEQDDNNVMHGERVRGGHKIRWVVSFAVFVALLATAMQFMCTSIQDVKEFLAWTVLLAVLLYAGCVR